MEFTGSIRIGPSFFAKVKNDYADWRFAWCREISQNSSDCGSTGIQVTIEEPDGHTIATVENNGEPMTREILTGKLLALGESGKTATTGQIGTFGRAKEIVYLSHERYEIHTGGLVVRGSGANYTIGENSSPLQGTPLLSGGLLKGPESLRNRGKPVTSRKRNALFRKYLGHLDLPHTVEVTGSNPVPPIFGPDAIRIASGPFHWFEVGGPPKARKGPTGPRTPPRRTDRLSIR